MLSGKDLFKYSKGLDKTIPQKGGDKDFLPDGSWLEDKKLEHFMVERHQVLSEPRVQRDGDLVKGEWNPERKLVEFKREMRNFWEHMGFVDSQRKWLYPEEALFLMEINVLEVWYKGLPLSTMDGYMLFLDKSFTMECYQVFSHLRRIGYVVLRHQGRLELTKYELQIGLDKCLSRRERNALRKPHEKKKYVDVSQVGKGEMTDRGVHKTEDRTDTVGMDVDTNQNSELETSLLVDSKLELSPISNRDSATGGNRNIYTEVDMCSTGLAKTGEPMDIDETSSTKSKLTDSFSSAVPTSEYPEVGISGTNKVKPHTVHPSKWNFDEIIFPDFGCETSVIVISQPSRDQTPGQLETKCKVYKFDRVKSINKKKEKRKDKKEAERNRKLNFSNPMMSGEYLKSIKECKSWQEYKEAKRRRKGQFNRKKEFPHLFDKVEPLVNPAQSTSTLAVLQQLQSIREEPRLQDRCDRPDVLPHFDVYKTDVKFRKSAPGIPDHRVVVTKFSDPMPDLSLVSSIRGYLGDEVPLNWAVIEYGNIAFYTLSDFSLPLDVSLG